MKLYEKLWFAWVMLFFVTPIGIYLMWKNNHYKKNIRVILTIVFSIYLFVVVYGSGEKKEDTRIENIETIVEKNVDKQVDTSNEYLQGNTSSESNATKVEPRSPLGKSL